MGDSQEAGAAASPRGDRAAVILTPDERVRVFISSTLQELAEERAAAAMSSGAPPSPAGPGQPGEAELPAGTVTVLLTDIEGSARLWETVPGAMQVALERHDRVLAEVIAGHDGVVVTSRGEAGSFFAVFASAVAAVEAAGACQLRLAGEAWPAGPRCGCGSGCTPARRGYKAATISTTRRSTAVPR